jgi:hypothetical protein
MTRIGMIFVTAIAVVAFLGAGFSAEAQREKKEPDKSQGASVSQTIGVDESIEITYHRPGVKGRDVFAPDSKLAPRTGKPWRAGANECTKITFSADVKVEGEDLAAGTYALFMIPGDEEWTIIFNTGTSGWGSFAYKEDEDVLRITVNAEEAPHEEWLRYGFDDAEATSCTAYLHWEKVKVPFKIELAE